MTLRNRVSVAAAVGVLIVVAAVSGVLYFSYAASLHSRVDATLVDAAQQASSITQRIKQSANGGGSIPDFGRPVTVGSVELQLFLRNPGRVLSHSQIFQAVWGYDFGLRSHNLWVYMSYLRTKLEAAGEPRILHTVRGLGYVLRDTP